MINGSAKLWNLLFIERNQFIKLPALSGLPLHRLQEIGARGRNRTCTGDALDVVSLLLDYASENGASIWSCPKSISLQKKYASCCVEAKYRIDVRRHLVYFIYD
jgi:hypothetical protein